MYGPSKSRSREEMISYVKKRTFSTEENMETEELPQTPNPGKSEDSTANTGEPSNCEAVDSARGASTNRAEFVKPKKTTNLSKIISVTSIEKRKAVEMQNRYSSLSESETEDEHRGITQKNTKRLKKIHKKSTMKEGQTNQINPSKTIITNDKIKSRKPSQPPPIVLKGNKFTTHKDLVDTLNKDIKNYTLKFTKNNKYTYKHCRPGRTSEIQ